MTASAASVLALAALFSLGDAARAEPVEFPEVPLHERTPGVKIAFLGDQGTGRDAEAVLRLVTSEGAQLLVLLGDLAYSNDADRWDRMLDGHLGSGVAVIGVLGNHDLSAAARFQAKLAARLARAPQVACSGEVARRSSCAFGPVSFALLGEKVAGSSDGDAFLRDTLARADSPWKVCVWHRPHVEMQVGGQKVGMPWAPYEVCREAGALVATGHEHSYSRTYLLEDYPAKRVASASGPLRLEPGRSFAFVSGLGGRSVRDQERDGSWWAAKYTSDQGASAGALFCTFGAPEPLRGDCYFKDIRGRVPDRFELEAHPLKPGSGTAIN